MSISHLSQPAMLLPDPRPDMKAPGMLLTMKCKRTGRKEEERKGGYCRICKEHGDHHTLTCPDIWKFSVKLCLLCDGPCQNEAEHIKEHYEKLMQCHFCSQIGSHWTQDCPMNFDTDFDDVDFDPPDVFNSDYNPGPYFDCE